jgi:hypothetical protein
VDKFGRIFLEAGMTAGTVKNVKHDERIEFNFDPVENDIRIPAQGARHDARLVRLPAVPRKVAKQLDFRLDRSHNLFGGSGIVFGDVVADFC